MDNGLFKQIIYLRIRFFSNGPFITSSVNRKQCVGIILCYSLVIRWGVYTVFSPCLKHKSKLGYALRLRDTVCQGHLCFLMNNFWWDFELTRRTWVIFYCWERRKSVHVTAKSVKQAEFPVCTKNRANLSSNLQFYNFRMLSYPHSQQDMNISSLPDKV